LTVNRQIVEQNRIILRGSDGEAWKRQQISLPHPASQTIARKKGLRLPQLRDYSVPAFDASDPVFLKVLSGQSS